MDAAGACDFGVNDDICLVGAVTAGWVTEVDDSLGTVEDAWVVAVFGCVSCDDCNGVWPVGVGAAVTLWIRAGGG